MTKVTESAVIQFNRTLSEWKKDFRESVEKPGAPAGLVAFLSDLTALQSFTERFSRTNPWGRYNGSTDQQIEPLTPDACRSMLPLITQLVESWGNICCNSTVNSILLQSQFEPVPIMKEKLQIHLDSGPQDGRESREDLARRGTLRGLMYPDLSCTKAYMDRCAQEARSRRP